MTLGQRLATRRHAAGLSQAELALRAGCHANTIVFLESGRVEHPRSDTIAAIAQVLQCDVGELIADSGAVRVAAATIAVTDAAAELRRVAKAATTDGVVDPHEAEQIKAAADRVDDATDDVVRSVI